MDAKKVITQAVIPRSIYTHAIAYREREGETILKYNNKTEVLRI